MMKNKQQMLCYECKKCNKSVYVLSTEDFNTKCKTCGNEMIFIHKADYNPDRAIKNINAAQKQKSISYQTNINTQPIVICPYCQSTDTTKITTTAKVVNTALWGIFGTKRHKEWHCNNCKSDF